MTFCLGGISLNAAGNLPPDEIKTLIISPSVMELLCFITVPQVCTLITIYS